MMPYDHTTSRYLDYLPAVFQQEDEENFLGAFLLAFEQVLTGRGDAASPGLEEILEGIGDGANGPLAGAQRYFLPIAEPAEPELDPDSRRAPPEFLDWLASWVALVLREDWSEEEKRGILASIVPAYRKRGTKDGLRQVLAAYLYPQITTIGDQQIKAIEIFEFTSALQIGVSSRVGLETVLGDGPPHYFLVRMWAPFTNFEDLDRRERIIRAIIDQQKPAHTYYDLQLEVRTMQVGVQSTVGVDTVLGTAF